ncbi:MAG: hypothetical protein U1F48_07400 [Burkholderiales bacterium]
MPPLGTGAYPVGCSNVEQDFSRVASGQSAQSYWDGVDGRYVTELLADPAHAIVAQQRIPSDFVQFGTYIGSTYPYVALVCYPTTAGNPYPDYPLPGGNAVPHMQRGADAPVFASAGQRYPVLLFSHGLSGSPIDGDYVEAVKIFASHGYVVVAPFHGDLRFADIDIADLNDALYALLHFQGFVAMQAVRPLSLSTLLTTVQNHPDFRDHVDMSRVGGFGASLGGESLLLMAGAKLTTSLTSQYSQVTYDDRLKAAVGYVPYFGIDPYPAFGRDLAGLDGVQLPFLAISGTADTTAPISVTEQGIRRLTNTRQLVALTGVRHGFDAAFASDIFTWSLRFLAGQLSGDPVARATSARMTSVQGGGDDVERIDYMAPVAISGTESSPQTLAVEFYNPSLNHYFMTAEPAEAAMLDAGKVVPGWQRTHDEFKVYPAGATAGLPACRFFGTPPLGPNSHFFTIDPAECAKVQANPLWTFEGIAFAADPPLAADCPAERIPVLRLYNNGMGGQANHRYTTSRSDARALVASGWIVEGPVFCAQP